MTHRRRLGWLAATSVLAFLVIADGASAQTTGASGSVISTKWEAIVVFVSVGLLGLAWFALTLYDRITANKWRTRGYKPFLDELLKANTGQLSAEELASFERAARYTPTGTTGLARSLP